MWSGVEWMDCHEAVLIHLYMYARGYFFFLMGKRLSYLKKVEGLVLE